VKRRVEDCPLNVTVKPAPVMETVSVDGMLIELLNGTEQLAP